MPKMRMVIRRGQPSPQPAQSIRSPGFMDEWERWLYRNRWNDRAERVIRESIESLPSRNLLSVIMPAYNTPPDILDAAIRSVESQVYQAWELCIADDGSTNEATLDILKAWARKDPRVRPIFRTTNGGISTASNDALAAAKGEFVVLMDHDDMITPDALAELALAIHENPEADLIYSDEDRISPEGRFVEPTFKPPFCLEMLATKSYVNHISAVRTNLAKRVGGFRSLYDGAQDHDLYLRVGREARKVVRIPKILYHWRMTPGSVSSNPGRCLGKGAAAVEDHLKSIGCPGKVCIHPQTYMFHIKFPNTGPKASVVIPTRDKPDLLRRVLETLRNCEYQPVEVVLVDTGTTDKEALAAISEAKKSGVKVVEDKNAPFNFSRACNLGAEASGGDILVFLNNDIEARHGNGWLSAMIGYANMPGVGAVGARLLFPNDTLQHVGVGLQMDGWMPSRLFASNAIGDECYGRYAGMPRHVAAVTAACMAVPKTAFNFVGGFDEAMPIDYNDTDLCLRLSDAGLKTVYCPWATLTHHESATRGTSRTDPAGSWEYRRRHWQRRDDFCNPNIRHRETDMSIVPARSMTRHPSRPIRVLAVSHTLHKNGATMV